MKFGLVSDVHGNPFALKLILEVLSELPVEKFFFLGDAVGYIPGEQEVFRILEQYDVTCQMGNHEYMLLHSNEVPAEKEDVYRLQPVLNRISNKQLGIIRAWPKKRVVEMSGRKLLFVHGGPEDVLDQRVLPDSDFARMVPLEFDGVFMGHTHRPFIHQHGSKLFVNIGSVGLPRDNGSLISCAVYDSAAHHCEILRVRYDWTLVENAYGTELHDSVRQLFKREEPDVYGTIVA